MDTSSYSHRLRITTGASVVIHVLLLTAAGLQPGREAEAIAVTNKPVVLNLRPETPEPPERPNRLIDAGAISDEAPDDTDMISSHNTKALSEIAGEGNESKPALERIDEFEDLGNANPSPQNQQVVAPVSAPTEAPRPTAEPTPPLEPVDTQDAAAALEAESRRATELPAPSAEAWEPELSPKPEPEPDPVPEDPAEEPMLLAQATPPSTPPVQEFRATRGVEAGGATLGGMSSFEAQQHELGAYMLVIRNHVEREWRKALQIRYPGASRASCTLECSIRPDGTLEYVRIVEVGPVPRFATLCKASVERASQEFPPFPFDVPDIYRNKNLEVRWRFTYM